MAGSPLDKIRNVNPRSSACMFHRNGEYVEATCAVEIRVRQRGQQRENIATKTVGACDEHAVLMFEKVAAMMNSGRI